MVIDYSPDSARRKAIHPEACDEPFHSRNLSASPCYFHILCRSCLSSYSLQLGTHSVFGRKTHINLQILKPQGAATFVDLSYTVCPCLQHCKTTKFTAGWVNEMPVAEKLMLISFHFS